MRTVGMGKIGIGEISRAAPPVLSEVRDPTALVTCTSPPLLGIDVDGEHSKLTKPARSKSAPVGIQADLVFPRRRRTIEEGPAPSDPGQSDVIVAAASVTSRARRRRADVNALAAPVPTTC